MTTTPNTEHHDERSNTMTTTEHDEALAPGKVPSRLDALGRPTEAVTPVSWVAAQHWDETLWVRA